MALLQIENLRKSFTGPDGERVAIIDVPQFALEARAQVGLQGGSGSGKTTFLHLIAGILLPDDGRITLLGRNLAGLSESMRDRLRARHVGYVFQTFNLLQGFTALENVLLAMNFGRGADRRLAEGLLKRVGLADRLHYYPRQLSVGQQQRVAVARAVANGPELVLADEPTGSLDQHHARASLDLLREVCAESDAALLLVSHDPDVLARFERVEQMVAINRAFARSAEAAGPGTATRGAAHDEPARPSAAAERRS